MRLIWLPIVLLFADLVAVARGETIASRPALEGVEPVATCKLQALIDRGANRYRAKAVPYTLQPLPEDPLANYERTSLGDWRMPAGVERGDPWLRLMLLGPKRPLLIDLAVFIDGRPFRESREAWIDELLTPKKTEAKEPAAKENEETTKDAESAKGVEEEITDEAKQEGKEDGAKSSGVPAQVRQAPTMRDRLVSYLAASDTEVDREEIRWLLAEWGTGPAVLLLGPSLSWQRAEMAPLVACLDDDADGALSAAEIAGVNDKLQQVDVDANEVVDANELRRAAKGPAATPFATGHSMIVLIDAETDWDELAATADRVYGKSDGDLRQLAEGAADVTLRIDFTADEKQTSGVSIIAVDAKLGDAATVVVASPEVVTLDLGGDYVEFSAAQDKVDAKTDVRGTQLAIGAVIDGNPLERLVDRDYDQRLTTRERQELIGLLATLDRDGDGAVGAGEMPQPIRFAVALGPRVHELLATPVGAARAVAPRDAAPAAPAWFASMDKNGDQDLSRGEFLGTTEQFRQFDADGDGLLSAAEAAKLDPGQ